MRVVRIYQEGTYASGQRLSLTSEAAQHVSVVLRMQVGERLTLFNGTNLEFQATISEVRKKQVVVVLDSMSLMSRESPVAIHLGQGISKGERMEWVVQKAVELGVDEITPLLTERCVVKLDNERMLKKIQQWQAIAVAACEQCGRNKIPIIHTPVHLDRFIETTQASFKFILNPKSDKTWRDYQGTPKEIALIIGPEGGLSSAEIATAEHAQFLPLTLGPRVLRTETAAITVLSLLQAVYGDL
jgi:16S rRNA (uracil1498-N3)-methyltransferase